MEIWTPFTVMKDSPVYLLMDEFSVHMMSSCCNEIKDCGTGIDHYIGGYISKLQVMDVGANKPFKGYVQQEYEKFILGHVDNMKVSREDVVHWIESGWKMVRVQTITWRWAKTGIEDLTTVV